GGQRLIRHRRRGLRQRLASGCRDNRDCKASNAQRGGHRTNELTHGGLPRSGRISVRSERPEDGQTTLKRIWRQIMAETNQHRRAPQQRRPPKQKRRLPEGSGVFSIMTGKEENALSLAGLAATYSPRA